MLNIRVRCISKNTGEVFYEYETKNLLELNIVQKNMKLAQSVFFKRLMSDLNEDCIFEFTVLHCREELPLDFKPSDVDDYNNNPVVF